LISAEVHSTVFRSAVAVGINQTSTFQYSYDILFYELELQKL